VGAYVTLPSAAGVPGGYGVSGETQGMCALPSGARGASIRALGVTGVASARVSLPSGAQGKIQALQAWSVVSSAVLGLPSAAGTPSVFAHPVVTARVSLPSAAGIVRASAAPQADLWAAAGFPLPEIQGYSYTNDPGLVRTMMRSGYSRQRRRWGLGYYQLSAGFTLQMADIPLLEQFFLENAAEWFTITLVTGNTERRHTVRLSGDPNYGNVYGENIGVTVVLDVQRDPQ